MFSHLSNDSVSERPKCNILVEMLLNPSLAIILSIHKDLQEDKACYLSFYWLRWFYIPSVPCLVPLAVSSRLGKTAQTAGFYIFDMAATTSSYCWKAICLKPQSVQQMTKTWSWEKESRRKFSAKSVNCGYGVLLVYSGFEVLCGITSGHGSTRLFSFRVPCMRARIATGTQYKEAGKNSLHLFKLD